MRYYEILVNSEYIGVASSNEFRAYQKRNNIMNTCSEADIEYIQCGEAFYHDIWMKTITDIPPADRFHCFDAEVIEITEDEYTIFNKAKGNKEIVGQLLEPQKVEEEPEEIDPKELPYVKEAKIHKLRSDCQKAIVSGFDMEFADGSVHHFSMELTDQMELQRLAMEGSDGIIPYHADGDIFRYYTHQDIMKIYDTMNDWKLYNTSYYSCLKRYINSMHTIKEIDDITYGCEIPKEYQSDVYKDIKEKLNL